MPVLPVPAMLPELTHGPDAARTGDRDPCSRDDAAGGHLQDAPAGNHDVDGLTARRYVDLAAFADRYDARNGAAAGDIKRAAALDKVAGGVRDRRGNAGGSAGNRDRR